MDPTIPLQSHTPSRAEQLIKKALIWVRTHQEQFWAIAGTIAGVALLVYFMVHRREVENEEAWVQLGMSHQMVLQGQNDQAAKSLDAWFARFSGTSAATYANFIRADLLYNTTHYADAAGAYGTIAQTGQPVPLRPLALSAQCAAQEMAGKYADAAATAQQFIDRYPDHFMAAAMYITQARLAEIAGNVANATAIYDRFVVLYPQSPWTAFARARLQSLSAIAPPAVKK